MKIKSKGEKLDFTATAANVVSRAIGENLFDGGGVSFSLHIDGHGME
jgi:hypothetical protein